MDSETKVTLGLLQAVNENSAHTQRTLAKELGIALGLANAYLKRCVKKGYVKVSQAPANRYAYYLTPTGFAEKSRLTAQYLSYSFQFFRLARNQCGELLAHCVAQDWRKIGLAGVSDLGEIAVLCGRDHPLSMVGFLDEAATGSFAGLPVVSELAALGPLDALVVTDLKNPQATYDGLAAAPSRLPVLVPPLLNIDRGTPNQPGTGAS
jgi:DNA-binding MarR family transcriptional regulator